MRGTLSRTPIIAIVPCYIELIFFFVVVVVLFFRFLVFFCFFFEKEALEGWSHLHNQDEVIYVLSINQTSVVSKLIHGQ